MRNEKKIHYLDQSMPVTRTTWRWLRHPAAPFASGMLGTGFQIVGSKGVGLLIIVGSLLWLWQIILPDVFTCFGLIKGERWWKKLLVGSMGVMVILFVGSLWFIAMHSSQLFIDVENDPYSVIPQQGQKFPPKVSKFAKVRVTNVGKTRVANVKAVVTQVDDKEEDFHLPLSSQETIFVLSGSALLQDSVSLNAGESVYFNALVECNGFAGCPNGTLAIPHTERGGQSFATLTRKGVSKPQCLTVRATGDGASATTVTFTISLESDGRLLLKPESGKQVR